MAAEQKGERAWTRKPAMARTMVRLRVSCTGRGCNCQSLSHDFDNLTCFVFVVLLYGGFVVFNDITRYSYREV